MFAFCSRNSTDSDGSNAILGPAETCIKAIISFVYIKFSGVSRRPLLSSRNDFLWTPVHDEAFLKAKQALTTAPTLAYFDPTKDTRLYTDASRLGLGFLLMQKSQQNESEWKLVQAGSRFLTDAETRYAVIELECLAVTWAIKKCQGCTLMLPTLGTKQQ